MGMIGNSIAVGFVDPSNIPSDVNIGLSNLGTGADTRKLLVASRGTALIKAQGDYDNASNEPGGAGLIVSYDGPTYNQGYLAAVQTAEQNGIGGACVGTLDNSVLLASEAANGLLFATGTGASAKVRAGIDNSYFSVYDTPVRLGTYAGSSSVQVGLEKTYTSPNSSRYGYYGRITIDNTVVLSADRTAYGMYSNVLSQGKNGVAFSQTMYGAYNRAEFDVNAGCTWALNEGLAYGAFNYALNNSDDPVYFRNSQLIGAYNYVYAIGDASYVTTAYGSYSRVNAGGTAATSTLASITGTSLFLGGTITGTFRVGQVISGTGVAAGTTITALVYGDGRSPGSEFTVSISQTVGERLISGSTDNTYSGTRAIGTAVGALIDVSTNVVGRNIGTAYGIRFTATEVGNIATKWGFYMTPAWANYIAGGLQIGGTADNAKTAGLTLGTATMDVPAGSAPLFACRAWVSFNGQGSAGANQTIRGSGNVSSVYKTGTGQYLINFATAMPDTAYSSVGTCKDDGGWNLFHPGGNTTYSTTAVQVSTYGSSNYGDSSITNWAFFR